MIKMTRIVEFEFSVAVSEEAEGSPKISFGNMKVRFSTGRINEPNPDLRIMVG